MNYSNIIRYDCANGEGWRTTLFVSGCNKHCKGCFNQKAQDFNYGEEFTMLTMKSVLDMVSDDRINGLSILGGDPLCQNLNDILKLTELCKRTRYKNKTVWLWSGYTLEEIFEQDSGYLSAKIMYQQELVKNVDVFIDGPFIEELKDPSLKWKGSSNQRVIDVQETLKQGQIVLLE